MGKRRKSKLNKAKEFVPSFLNSRCNRNIVGNTQNGLYLINMYMPDEIVLHILSFVQPEMLLQYSLVCRKWNQLIKSYSMWSMIYERKYNCKAKKLPWYLYYSLLSGSYFDTNLLLNGNGQEGLKYWDCKVWEGDTYVEDIPLGVDPLPMDVPEFNNVTSCFVTSYFTGSKGQLVTFGKNKLFQYILNTYKPYIYLSEWMTGNFDCGCVYQLECGFIGDSKCNTAVSKPFVTHCKDKYEDPKWTKVELVIMEYPDRIEGIIFENSGYNLQTWKGHYGIKMAGGVVKFLFDSIEPLPIEHGNVKPKKFSKIQFVNNQLHQAENNDHLAANDIWNEEYDDEIYYFMP